MALYRVNFWEDLLEGDFFFRCALQRPRYTVHPQFFSAEDFIF